MKIGFENRRSYRTLLLDLVLGLFLCSSTLAAQSVAPPPPEISGVTESGETIFTLLLKGGWLMIPIVLCSVIVLTLAIERTISLRRSRTIPPDLLDTLYETLPAHGATRSQQKDASQELEQSSSILGEVLQAGVDKLHRGKVVTETFVREAATKQFHILKRRLRPFSVVASLAPLLGLLGTIYGMIVCFENAAAADAAARAESLARGIYGALVTTAAGLSVAIPSLVFYHYFEGRVDRIADTLEESAADIQEHYFGDRGASAPGAKADLTARLAAPAAPAAAHRKA